MTPTDLLLVDLQQDTNGVLLKELRDRLAAMRVELRRKQDTGLASDEFAVSEKVLAAVHAAEQVLTGYWDFVNKK